MFIYLPSDFGTVSSFKSVLCYVAGEEKTVLLQEVDSLEDQKRSLRSNIETLERDQKTLRKEIQSLSEERDGLLYKVHFFFIGNSIFHLSLELLMKFWKMRLKVA